MNQTLKPCLMATESHVSLVWGVGHTGQEPVGWKHSTSHFLHHAPLTSARCLTEVLLAKSGEWLPPPCWSLPRSTHTTGKSTLCGGVMNPPPLSQAHWLERARGHQTSTTNHRRPTILFLAHCDWLSTMVNSHQTLHLCTRDGHHLVGENQI